MLLGPPTLIGLWHQVPLYQARVTRSRRSRAVIECHGHTGQIVGVTELAAMAVET
jgi:hypothetical protein